MLSWIDVRLFISILQWNSYTNQLFLTLPMLIFKI